MGAHKSAALTKCLVIRFLVICMFCIVSKSKNIAFFDKSSKTTKTLVVLLDCISDTNFFRKIANHKRFWITNQRKRGMNVKRGYHTQTNGLTLCDVRASLEPLLLWNNK